MIELTSNAKASAANVGAKFLTRLSREEIKDSRFWVVVAVIILSLFLFWAGALVYAYVKDDLSTMPADESSVPAPQPY